MPWAALAFGSLLLLLRDTRVIPAAIVFPLGTMLCVVAISARRPILLARFGETVLVCSTTRTETHSSPLRGRVTKTHYVWTIVSGGRRTEWTARNPIPEGLACKWTDQLVAVGFSREETS